MGRAMAANLRHKGFDLVVLDIDPRPVQALVALGAQAGESVAQIARDCGIVITMLPTAVEVEQVAMGAEGVFANAMRGSVLMGAACGPGDPAQWQALSDFGSAIGLAFQVVDDVLDVTADSATLGKTAGKDAQADKPTYVSVLGLERSRGTDLGLHWASGAHRLNVTAFQNRFANYIALYDTGNHVDGLGHAIDDHHADPAHEGHGAVLTEQAYRGVRARFTGVELQGNWRLREQGSTLDLQWRIDQVRALNLDSGQAMPRTPPLRVGATLVHGQGAWSARLGFEHAAAQNRVPTGSVATSAYTLWHAGWHFQQRQPVGTLH
jgi:hypothetical protein